MDGKKLLLTLLLAGPVGMTVWFAAAGAIAADTEQLKTINGARLTFLKKRLTCPYFTAFHQEYWRSPCLRD